MSWVVIEIHRVFQVNLVPGSLMGDLGLRLLPTVKGYCREVTTLLQISIKYSKSMNNNKLLLLLLLKSLLYSQARHWMLLRISSCMCINECRWSVKTTWQNIFCGREVLIPSGVIAILLSCFMVRVQQRQCPLALDEWCRLGDKSVNNLYLLFEKVNLQK